MIPARRLSRPSRNILLIIVISAIVIGVIIFYKNRGSSTAEFVGLPTNFSAVGVLNVNTGATVPAKILFVYEEEGKPSLSNELVLDENSVCAGETGSNECIAMNISPDIAFNNKKAIIEGIETSDHKIVVKKLQVISNTIASPFIPNSGITYIPWMQAKQLIESCQVKMITQAHSLNVDMELKDERHVTAVERTIDEVFGVAGLAKEKCGNIPLATE